MLRERCPSVCLSVCKVGVLWPNSWMDQDTTWYGDRPRPRRHCVRWGPSSPMKRGTFFGPYLLWPNGRPSKQLLALVYNDVDHTRIKVYNGSPDSNFYPTVVTARLILRCVCVCLSVCLSLRLYVTLVYCR